MGIEESMQRHPAGSLREHVEKTPLDLGWALAKSAELARVAERERIIKLLEDSDSVCNEWAIALIKGENK
jgi:hypothetical protein